MARHASPLENFVVGGACIIGYVVCASFTILTDENLMQGGDGSGVRRSLDLVYQLWDLARGAYAGWVAATIILSWIIFLVYVMSTAGYTSYKDHLDGRGKGLGDFFHSMMVVIIVFDGYANFHYAKSAPNPFWQWFVAFLIAFVLFFAGPYGWHKIMEAVEDMR